MLGGGEGDLTRFTSFYQIVRILDIWTWLNKTKKHAHLIRFTSFCRVVRIFDTRKLLDSIHIFFLTSRILEIWEWLDSIHIRAFLPTYKNLWYVKMTWPILILLSTCQNRWCMKVTWFDLYLRLFDRSSESWIYENDLTRLTSFCQLVRIFE